MTTDCADKSVQHSGQGLPKDAVARGPSPLVSWKPDGWFPPSRPRRGCEDC
jgi:hypothetical protein